MSSRLLMLALALGLPAAAWAHGVSHEVERRGDAVAVRARYHGGKALAGATYQVLAPGQPDRIRAEGRTGTDGWLEFAPDVPGTWRVRIADATGHGGLFRVEVKEVARIEAAPAAAPASAPAPAAAVPAAAAAAAAPAPAAAPAEPAPVTAPSPRAPLRTVAAAAAIVVAFAALRAIHRRRARGR